MIFVAMSFIVLAPKSAVTDGFVYALDEQTNTHGLAHAPVKSMTAVLATLQKPNSGCNRISAPLSAASADPELRAELTESEAFQVFQSLRNDPKITHELPENNYCTGRALKMGMLLEEKGIYSKKVFLYDQSMRVPNPFVANETLLWTYHTAPVVKVRRADGPSVDMVFDPSLFAKPVTLETWRSALTTRTCSEIPVTSSSFHPPDCSFQITERFTFKPSRASAKDTSWRQEDLDRATNMMDENLPQALIRRSMHAAIESPDGKLIPSGNCVNNTGDPTTADVVNCQPAGYEGAIK